MELDDVLRLIAESWPEKYERGRVISVHRNYLKLPDGRTVHLRVMIQTVADQPQQGEGFETIT